MTQSQLAALVHKSPIWIRQILQILTLDQEAQLAVDRGEIPIESAYFLARISDGLPKMEKIVAEINKFLTVKNDGVETVQKDERKARPRDLSPRDRLIQKAW